MIHIIKILSLFSGIGAYEKALSRLGFNYKVINWCENDKYASKAYSAIHNVSDNLNLSDIKEVNEKDLPDFDLATWSFPCQDISISGKQKGITNKTRSGLLFDALRIIKHKTPPYSICENVKNLVGKRFKKDFEWLLEELNNYGYNNYWKILNAKDYGIPQNRERVFLISIRKDVDDGKFKFPNGFDNGVRLKNLMESDVDDKYYIDQKKANKFINGLKNKNISNSIRVGGRGSLDRHQWDLILEENNNILPHRDINYYIDANYANCMLTDLYKIRRLTPLECWRLMGFNDSDYWKARKILEDTFYNGRDRSNSQMYKMAGNSIVVNVLEYIFINLFRLVI